MAASDERYRHQYTYIEQRDVESFGRALTQTLSDIHKQGAVLVHVSTQVLPTLDSGMLWIGQVVCRHHFESIEAAPFPQGFVVVNGGRGDEVPAGEPTLGQDT